MRFGLKNLCNVEVYYLIAPRHSELALESLKRWLIVNNAAIIGTVLLILGVMLLGAGIQGLMAL